MDKGTLRIVVFVEKDEWDDLGDSETAVVLAWEGQPFLADLRVGALVDCDLGDYECKDLPELAGAQRGLFVLEWPWHEALRPDPTHEGDYTAVYGDGTWRPATAADLVHFRILGASPAVSNG